MWTALVPPKVKSANWCTSGNENAYQMGLDSILACWIMLKAGTKMALDLSWGALYQTWLKGLSIFCLLNVPLTKSRDNPEVDILGANLYNMYLRRYQRLSSGCDASPSESGPLDQKVAVSPSRTVPYDACFLPQTVRGVECTYSSSNSLSTSSLVCHFIGNVCFMFTNQLY